MQLDPLNPSIFVSYAQVDNQVFPGEREGWITLFVKHLRHELNRRMGQDNYTLWMDFRLKGNDELTLELELEKQVKAAQILLLFLSPAWLASKWCQRDLDLFLEDANKERSRCIFVVELNRVERPEAIRDLAGYRFWQQEVDGRIRLVGYPVPHPKSLDDRSYFDRLFDLADDLATKLREHGVARGKTRRVRVPDIAWVEIPEGPFIYQNGETRTLPTFWIARYPITNSQFQTFIDDGGYSEDRWWQGLKKPEPGEPHWQQGNRPRTDVDWFEAIAFTRWLSARLGLAEDALRLPTEEEWEKAARGQEGLVYPWGNEYRSGFANINETWDKTGLWKLEQTTAVGLYPQGRSPYGVEDLAGTVWEWCLNQYDNPENTAIDTSDASRVLRGGSWDLASDFARAVFRFSSHPFFRSHDIGFRLVSLVPISVR